MFEKIFREMKNFIDPQIESNEENKSNALMCFLFKIEFPEINEQEFQSAKFYENIVELKYIITEENINKIPKEGDYIDEFKIIQLNKDGNEIKRIVLKKCEIKKVGYFEYFSYLYNEPQQCSLIVDYKEKVYE